MNYDETFHKGTYTVELVKKIVRGEKIEPYNFDHKEALLDVEVDDETCVGMSSHINVFDVCAFHRYDLLPMLFEKGMRPRKHCQTYSNPLFESLWEEDECKAEVLSKCGYSLFDDRCQGIYTFMDDRFYYDGRLGDALDALFLGGKLKGLSAAIKISKKDNIEKRDKERDGLFTIEKMIKLIQKANITIFAYLYGKINKIT